MRSPSHRRRSRFSLLASACLLHLFTVAAINIDCEKVPADKKIWDLSALGGPKSIYMLQQHPPNVKNTTFNLDLCKPLRKPKGIDKGEFCQNGARVCGIETIHRPNDDENFTIEGVITIAGRVDGRPLDPVWTRLNTSSHPQDRHREGLRLKMGGGLFPINGRKTKQETVIEFLCKREGDGESEDMRRRAEAPEFLTDPSRRKIKKDDDDDSDKDGDDNDNDGFPELPHDGETTSDGAGGTLKYISYDMVGDNKVLSLEWRTPRACEDDAKDSPNKGKTDDSSGGHWGFFTWLIIIIFLFTATYLIFGSWLNYNRYSARGWDLLPHSETLRDLPYLFREWARKAVDTIQGRGSRGGYSAV